MSASSLEAGFANKKFIIPEAVCQDQNGDEGGGWCAWLPPDKQHGARRGCAWAMGSGGVLGSPQPGLQRGWKWSLRGGML